MYLVDRCVLPPGACFICRSPKRETESAIVDTMREVEVDHIAEARLYLCETCVTEAATMFGFVTPAMAARYVDERDIAIRQATDLRTEVEALRVASAALAGIVPTPEAELAATPQYWCEECERGFQNPQSIGRHRQAKHGAPPQFVARGDEVLELTAEVDA